MTVSTEVSREEYTGNGVTTDFDYRFRVFSADELVVTVADTTENIRTLVMNTDYTVTGAGSRNGGKVKLVSALASNWRISIERELPVTQETDIRNQGNFFPEVHEDAWDKLTMLIQQAFNWLGLALRKPNWLAKYYDAKGNRIINLADPIADNDAVNRRSMYSYVEKMIAGVVGGFGWFRQFGAGAIDRTFQDKMRERLSVIDFGADPTGVIDSTQAFRNAIAAAIANGYKSVYAPAGNYLVTDSLNLGGVGYVAPTGTARGVALVGENWVNTVINFRPNNNNSACIEILGGSGAHSPCGLDEIHITAAADSLYTGVGYRLAGACHVMNGRFMVSKFAVNIHLLNNRQPGVFTEFNKFHDAVIHRGMIGVLMEVNGGDESFHGNDFIGCKFQVKDSRNIADGNITPGVGIELRGVTKPAYWYDAFIDIHMFGGPDAVGIKLTKANTDAIVGNIVAENNLILKSTDATSVFEIKGGLYSIGSVIFDVVSEPATKASTFIFENRMSNTASFSSPKLAGLSPRQMPLYLADRTDAGGYPVIFRATGTNTEGICYATSGTAGSYHIFGYIPPGGNLQSFVPGMRLGFDGGVLSSYSNTFYISNAATGVQLSPSFFGPQVDNALDFGAAAFRVKQYWGANSSINTSDARHKTTPRNISVDEINAFYEIGQLPWVWQWLERYSSEGDEARLHSGPTVQAAISVMDKHGLNWSDYSAFCYDRWDGEEERKDLSTGELIPAVEAGDRYSFRKEELLLWISRATIEKQKEIESRVSMLESSSV
ncbi:tail fiber domain-containing protein [Serratia sp. TKO39]|uniref:tail fiber domain-containing protein n=1 Tax=Serratia sp. TKO39 TaxID=2052589 RepID=UPI0018E22867|nr:tail fiber domain-containing protein [Serratia sp. TKO39]